ncbi:porin [Lutimonas sp.]|uniref:porin n=1 Tax=Lutimonas sp. TaxID=1872403 RepID=UPI003D9B1399
MKLIIQLIILFTVLLPVSLLAQRDPDSVSEKDTNKSRLDSIVQDHFLMYDWESGSISFGGSIHRTIMYVDDGLNNDFFFMDSEQPPTHLRVSVENSLNENISVFGNLWIGIQSNRPFEVSQDNKNPGVAFRALISEVGISHKKIGSLELGSGFTSSAVFTEVDMSGTSIGSMLTSGNLAPGMKFVDADSNELSDRQVFNYFLDTERLMLADRIRFDSKSFAGGFMVSASAAADSRWDASVRFFPEVGKWAFRAVLTYEQKPFRDLDSRTLAGFGIRHEETGINLTTIASYGFTPDDRDPYGFVIKGGIQQNFTDLGKTSFSIDYAKNHDATIEGERATSYSFFVNQSINPINLVIYLGYRKYDVTDSDLNLLPINTTTLGVFFNF